MTAPLQVRDVVVDRGERRILDGVSLTIHGGNRTLVRGASGAGKSTLFEVVGALRAPASGQVMIDGTNPYASSRRRRARLRRSGLGLIFQSFRLIPDLTAWENARLPLEHGRGGPSEADRDRLASLFDTLEIASLSDRRPPTLSGGERQRVAIARALAPEPAVVVADEPTGQLDPETTNTVRDLLIRAQDETGTALLVTSHDPSLGTAFEDVRRLADGTLSGGG